MKIKSQKLDMLQLDMCSMACQLSPAILLMFIIDCTLSSASNALTGEGLHEGVEWLTGNLLHY